MSPGRADSPVVRRHLGALREALSNLRRHTGATPGTRRPHAQELEGLGLERRGPSDDLERLGPGQARCHGVAGDRLRMPSGTGAEGMAEIGSLGDVRLAARLELRHHPFDEELQ